MSCTAANRTLLRVYQLLSRGEDAPCSFLLFVFQIVFFSFFVHLHLRSAVTLVYWYGVWRTDAQSFRIAFRFRSERAKPHKSLSACAIRQESLCVCVCVAFVFVAAAKSVQKDFCFERCVCECFVALARSVLDMTQVVPSSRTTKSALFTLYPIRYAIKSSFIRLRVCVCVWVCGKKLASRLRRRCLEMLLTDTWHFVAFFFHHKIIQNAGLAELDSRCKFPVSPCRYATRIVAEFLLDILAF